MARSSNCAAQTIHELQPLLAAGTVSAADVLQSVLDRIERFNPSLHAYLDSDLKRLREHRPPASRGPLWGIPITIKDNLCIAGEETACASKILKGFRAPYNATAIERLRHAGALLIPRANMDEFAFGSSTENSAYGVTKNPWALDRVPGGSSGGSAAAVAADCAIAALGSDTGGSIRQPAAFCGVVGLKPTYGRVSRYGLVAFASSLDQIGPITKDVTDCAILLSVIAGHDPRDSTSAPVPVPEYLSALKRPAKGLRIGIPKEYLVEGIDPEVRAAIDEAIKVFEQIGCACAPVSLPHTKYAIATYYIIATGEASSNLARYDGVRYGFRAADEARHATRDTSEGQSKLLEMYLKTRTDGFGAEPKRRILLGTYVLSQGYYDAYYVKGLKVRTLIKRDFDKAFEQADVILTPTSPTPAFKIGEKLNDPLQMYLSDIFTISANLAGIPALSMPCGFTKMNLPIGMQLLAGPFKEEVLLQAAFAYEQATEWHKKKPAIQTADHRQQTSAKTTHDT